MKPHLPIALLACLFSIGSALNAAPVSTWDELVAALPAEEYPTFPVNIQLAGAVFEIPASSELTYGGTFNFTGVKGQTIFRGASVASTVQTNRPFNWMGGILTLENIRFENFRQNGSDAKSSLSGGAIGGNGGAGIFKFVDFYDNGVEVTTTSKSASASNGAAGFGDRRSNISNFSDCSFVRNYAKASAASNYSSATSGALFAFGDYTGSDYPTPKVLRCLFEGNYAEARSTSNSAYATYGALSYQGIVEQCIFRENYVHAVSATGQASAEGGAMYNFGGYSLLYQNGYGAVNNCLFERNYASAESERISEARGGAVYGIPSLRDCDFYDNYTMAATISQGGAVFVNGTYGDGMQGFLLEVSAIDKDSVFRGNRMGVTRVDPVTGKPLDGIANAIYTFPQTYNLDTGIYTYTYTDSLVNFKAQAGRSIYFYDPVVLQVGMYETRPCDQRFDLNKPDGDSDSYEGRIVFTGEDFAATDNPENWTSRLYYGMDMHLYGGSLVIRDKAIVGAPYLLDDSYDIPADSDYDREIGPKSFTMDKGTLEITGNGQLLAREVVIDGGHELTTFRTGTGAQLTARSIDLSGGVSFDFSPFLDNHDSGLRLSAGTVSLGGIMGITDTLDYYTDRRWASSQEYLALSFTGEAAGSLEGSDFTDILTHATGSAVIDSPYTYKGYWSKVWKDTDGDGINDELYAVWTPTGVIEEVAPELSGDSTLNSLWSTVSNMEALSSAALGQINASRYKLERCAHYWAQGLGDFDMHRSVKNVDGYDYNGFGYAVGADTKLCPDNWLLGAAFGNLYGKNKSRSYNSEIRQTSYIGMIYGGYYKEYDPANALNVTASASYGVTSNRLHTYYPDGGRSNGKWDNKAMRFTLKGEWMHALNDTWSLNPFLGLEYDDAKQDSFTESGDKARHFGNGRLRNLAMPVGAGLWRTDRFENGHVWLNGVELSYAPDIYRKNPEAGAERLSNGFTWTARGVEPSRHAGRAAYKTRVIWNKTWSTFAGYELEWRKNAVYQDVNLGFSASF